MANLETYHLQCPVLIGFSKCLDMFLKVFLRGSCIRRYGSTGFWSGRHQIPADVTEFNIINII